MDFEGPATTEDQLQRSDALTDETLATREFDKLTPQDAMSALFDSVDRIEYDETSLLDKAAFLEKMTLLLRAVSKIENPESRKIFREDPHFLKLGISSKFWIRNSLDRDLHAKLVDYLNQIDIEVSEEELVQIRGYFTKKDTEKRGEIIRSYAEDGLLTLQSAIESGVIWEFSSTPGDFSSLEDLQHFPLDDHNEVRGYVLAAAGDDDLFYGSNGFFQVVLERSDEEIDSASKLPPEEIENRLRNSMLIVINSAKVEISGRADNLTHEDVIAGDIDPEEIDYVLVDSSNLSIAQKAFAELDVEVLAVDATKSELHDFYSGPYTLPDYKAEVEKIVHAQGRVWCHIARLPVDTYPK